MVERTGYPPDGQAFTTPATPVLRSARPEKKNKSPNGVHLPVLVEFIFTFSVILLSVLFLAMSIVAWVTHTSLIDFVLRTGVSVLVQGSLLILISRQVSTGVLKASKDEMEEEAKKIEIEKARKIEASEAIEKQSNAEAQLT